MEQETKANSETNALGIDMKNKNDEPLINLKREKLLLFLNSNCFFISNDALKNIYDEAIN